MEVMRKEKYGLHWAKCCICALVFTIIANNVYTQQPIKKYIVRDGKMLIELSKKIKEKSLDSFITQYGLADVGLKQFINTNKPDSLIQSGWQIELNNQSTFTISKPLLPSSNFHNVATNIILAQKHPTLSELFPAVNNGVVYGNNLFRNKAPFAVKKNVVTFFLRNNMNAKRVMLAGSFNQWNPDALAMTKTDSGWIAEVPLNAGKYWYKFIADGHWLVDNDNLLRENDGRGNINSVFYKTNAIFNLPYYKDARKVYLAGSFNNWQMNDLAMKKTATGWELPLYLSEGTHTYKFVVDGAWIGDQNNTQHLPDGHGGFNAVLRIGNPHLFELNAFTTAKQVVLSGSFNGWREDELLMKKTDNGWQIPYTLGPGNYEYKFIVDGKWITDPANPAANNDGNSYLIIQPNYVFRLKGFSKSKTVYLSGDFNNWSPDSYAMKREGNDWVFGVHLSVGKHLYKFVVDGNWIIDPDNKLWEQNEYGTGNSIIWVDE